MNPGKTTASLDEGIAHLEAAAVAYVEAAAVAYVEAASERLSRFFSISSEIQLMAPTSIGDLSDQLIQTAVLRSAANEATLDAATQAHEKSRSEFISAVRAKIGVGVERRNAFEIAKTMLD